MMFYYSTTRDPWEDAFVLVIVMWDTAKIHQITNSTGKDFSESIGLSSQRLLDLMGRPRPGEERWVVPSEREAHLLTQTLLPPGVLRLGRQPPVLPAPVS